MQTEKTAENPAAANPTPCESTIPTITLAGKQWPVPQLAPRQNRIVVPALLEIVPKIVEARAQAGNTGLGEVAYYLDTAIYDRLTDVVYFALTRAHPQLSRAEFDDMPIDTTELFAALSVIASQAGLLRRH
jgi:hypothetical protein